MSHTYSGEVILNYVANGIYPAGSSQNQQRSIRCYAANFIVKEGRLYYKKKSGKELRVVMSDDQREEIYMENHTTPKGTHHGIERTFQRIAAIWYWYGLKDYLRLRVGTCEVCQQSKKMKTVVPKPKPKPIKSSKPLDVVGIDLIGPLPQTKYGNCFIITMTCHFSKWVVAYPLKDKCGTEISSKLVDYMYTFGPPNVFLVGRGKEFMTLVNDAIFQEFKIKNRIPSASYPRCVSHKGNAGQNLKQMLSKLANQHQTDWDEYVKSSVFKINTTYQTSTQFTPYEVLFGRTVDMLSELDDAAEEIQGDASAENYEVSISNPMQSYEEMACIGPIIEIQ